MSPDCICHHHHLHHIITTMIIIIKQLYHPADVCRCVDIHFNIHVSSAYNFIQNLRIKSIQDDEAWWSLIMTYSPFGIISVGSATAMQALKVDPEHSNKSHDIDHGFWSSSVKLNWYKDSVPLRPSSCPLIRVVIWVMLRTLPVYSLLGRSLRITGKKTWVKSEDELVGNVVFVALKLVLLLENMQNSLLEMWPVNDFHSWNRKETMIKIIILLQWDIGIFFIYRW